MASACQLRGKVGGQARLRHCCASAALQVIAVLFVRGGVQGFVLRLRCLQFTPLGFGSAGLGLRSLPPLLGLRCVRVGVQQRLQLLLFVLPLLLGSGGVQLVMLQCLQCRPQLALFLGSALGVQDLGLLGL